ncbi:hypothetical protein BGZ97_007632 [Linnemannia gamsii]|uniref:Arm-like repeat domain-containing protein n=1 Tax=Linnemannia gamsii TaxID=64522 RepID=A0A9P6RF27_9FUNG|nr:hypothetical protein BGZ97_007632 [Linnemannia gamsii]
MTPLKASAAVEEIVLVKPVLDRKRYRNLLTCFNSNFEESIALDVTVLQDLVQLAAAASATAVSSVSKLDPEGLLKGIESLQRIGAEVVGGLSTGIEVVETLRAGAGGVNRASEAKFHFMRKRSWYLALQGTGLFIRQGATFTKNNIVDKVLMLMIV